MPYLEPYLEGSHLRFTGYRGVRLLAFGFYGSEECCLLGLLDFFGPRSSRVKAICRINPPRKTFFFLADLGIAVSQVFQNQVPKPKPQSDGALLPCPREAGTCIHLPPTELESHTWYRNGIFLEMLLVKVDLASVHCDLQSTTTTTKQPQKESRTNPESQNRTPYRYITT